MIVLRKSKGEMESSFTRFRLAATEHTRPILTTELVQLLAWIIKIFIRSSFAEINPPIELKKTRYRKHIYINGKFNL